MGPIPSVNARVNLDDDSRYEHSFRVGSHWMEMEANAIVSTGPSAVVAVATFHWTRPEEPHFLY